MYFLKKWKIDIYGRQRMDKKAFILLFAGIFVLSGCGQSDIPSVENVASRTGEEINTGYAESGGISGTGGIEEDENSENNESAEALPQPLEVPVNTRAEEIHYHSGDDIHLGSAMRRCRSDGDNIYLVYGGLDLYVMPISADEHSRADIDNPEGLDVCNITMDIYGRIHLLMSRGGEEWFIWRLDEDYQIEKVTDVSAYFETPRVPVCFLIDKDGTYCFLWSIDRDGIIVDSEGELKHRFNPKSLEIRWIYEAAAGKDGRIYLVYSDGDDKLKIGELDVESGAVKKEASALCFPGSENFTSMSGGTDTNLLLFSPYSGIWAYDHENGVMENRVPLSEIGFDNCPEFYPLGFLADGRLLLMGWSDNDYYLKYIPAGK